MITVSVAEYGREYAVEIIGHSEYAKRGEDIVCAGVTALAAALNGFAEEDTVQAGDGCYYAVIDAKYALAVEMFSDGIREIERMYPDYVEFNG